MISQPDVDKLIRQTKQYEFADGLQDLQMALIMVTLGTTSWLVFDLVYVPFIAKLMKTFGSSAVWFSLLLVILPALVGLGTVGLMNYVRQRWLWRESGVVKPLFRLIPRRVTILAVVVYLVSLGSTLGLHFAGWVETLFTLQMLVVAAGWSTGVTLIGFGRAIGLTHYIWLGIMGGLASTILLFLPLTFGQTALIFGLAWGFMFAATGIVLLRRTLLSL